MSFKSLIIGILLILLAMSVSTNIALAQGMPRPFQNKAELHEWVADRWIYRGGDCDDAALQLFWDAWHDGYLVWPVPVWKGTVMNEAVIDRRLSGKRHFGNWAWVGNDIYYVDLALKPPHYVKLKNTWLDD